VGETVGVEFAVGKSISAKCQYFQSTTKEERIRT
jgi:hypothetical protein